MLWWTRRRLKSSLKNAVSAAEQLRASSSDIRNLSLLAEFLLDPRNAIKQVAESAFLESSLPPEARADLAIKAGAYALAARVALANPRPRGRDEGYKSKSGLYGKFFRESEKKVAEALRIQDRIAEALGELGQQTGVVEALLLMMEKRPSSGLVRVLEKFAPTRREEIVEALKRAVKKGGPNVLKREEQFSPYVAAMSLLVAIWSGPDAVRWLIQGLLEKDQQLFNFDSVDYWLDFLVQGAGTHFKEALTDVYRNGGSKLKPRAVEAMKRHGMTSSQITEVVQQWRDEHAATLRDQIAGMDEVLRLLEKEKDFSSEQSQLVKRLAGIFNQTQYLADESALPWAFKSLKYLETRKFSRGGHDECCIALVPILHHVLQYFAAKVRSDDLRQLATTSDLPYQSFVAFHPADEKGAAWDWEEWKDNAVDCSQIRELALRELSRRGLSVARG